MEICQKKIKILLIRFSAIGDLVLTTPIIRCIKTQIPNAEIHFCTKAVFASLFTENPYISQVKILKNSLKELLSELKQEKYDYVIDLHKKIRSMYLCLFLGGKQSSYCKYSLRRFLYTRFQIDCMPKIHVVDRYIQAAKTLGIVNDGKGIDYFIPASDEIKLSDLPASFANGYTCYILGGSKFTKLLPMHKMIELCDQIADPIVLIGGKEDWQRAEALYMHYLHKQRTANQRKILLNLAGKLSIHGSASIVRQAKQVIGHDTGLTHIAAAFHDTVYSIWGGTTPSGYKPYCLHSIVLENKLLRCRPCSKSGRNNCPKKHFKCLQDIDLTLPCSN